MNLRRAVDAVSFAVCLVACVHAMPAAAQVVPAPDQAVRPAAQADTATPRVGPPIQRIETASAVSTEPLGMIMGVRELPDGRVLVNDGQRRRLLLMDTALATVGVVLDSLSHIENTYGVRPGTLLPYPGDSTLFLDPASLAMLVIDPAGRVARVRSVWRAEHVGYLSSLGGSNGWPGIGADNRIVYRVRAQNPRGWGMQSSGVPYIPVEPDSAFIVAVDLATRTLDTLGVVRTPTTELRIRPTGEGFTIDQVVNPFPVTDDWAVLPDQRIAFLRYQDYRIDYLNPDGSWSSSQKLPYEWQRITDDDKVRIVDSTRVAQQKNAAMQYVTSVIRWVNMYNQNYPENFGVPEGYVMPPGFPKDWLLPPGLKFPDPYVYACAPGVEPPAGMNTMMMGGAASVMVESGARTMVTGAPAGAAPAGAATPGAARGAAGGAPGAAPAGPAPCLPAPPMMGGSMVPPPPQVRPVVIAEPETLPDYKPPFGSGALRADEDGNLWIRTNPVRTIPGGPVYDIVDPKGDLVNRIQLPQGYALVGFGKGKVVYLSMRDASGIHLARVRLR